MSSGENEAWMYCIDFCKFCAVAAVGAGVLGANGWTLPSGLVRDLWEERREEEMRREERTSTARRSWSHGRCAASRRHESRYKATSALVEAAI